MLCHDRQVCSYAATQLLKGPFPLHAKILQILLEALSNTVLLNWLIRVQSDILDKRACCTVKCRRRMLRSEPGDHSISLSGLSGDKLLQSRFPLMTVFG